MKILTIVIGLLFIFVAIACASPPAYSPVSVSCRVLDTSVTAFTNTTTGEETAYTYTLPGGTMDEDNDRLIVTVKGTAGATNASQLVKVYFGSTSRSLVGANGRDPFSAIASITRTAAATQTMITDYRNFSTAIGSIVGTLFSDSPTETLSGDIVVRATVEAGNGDTFTAVEWEVKLCPAP